MSAVIPISEEMLRDGREFEAAIRRWSLATPAEREQWAREAAEKRAAERAATPETPLTFETLAARLGWSEPYLRHFIQPYCTCDEGGDGWEYCEHARDEGLDR